MKEKYLSYIEMPFHLIKVNRGWKVEDDKGNVYSNHPLTKKRATAQLKALYASYSRGESIRGKGYATYSDDDGHHLVLQGEGFFSDIFAKAKKIAQIVASKLTTNNLRLASDVLATGIREDYPPDVRSVLAQYGLGQVFHLAIYRDPIKSYIDNVLNIISLGQWNVAKDKLNYDKMYHLSMIASLNMPNGNKVDIKIEKNEVINITPTFTISSDAEVIEAPVPCCFTLQQLLDNAKQQMGVNFFKYDAFTNNCQAFILGILRANNLVTPDIEKFVSQDALALAKELPEHIPAVASTLTNLAGFWNRLYKGQGIEFNARGNNMKGGSVLKHKSAHIKLPYTGLYAGPNGVWKIVKDGSAPPQNVGFYFKADEAEPKGGKWIWTGAPSNAPWMANWSQQEVNEMLAQKNDEVERMGAPQINADTRTEEQKQAEEAQDKYYAEHPEANPANYKSEEDYKYGDNPLITFSESNPGPIDTTTGAKAISARKLRDGSYEITYDNGSVERTPGVLDQWVTDNRGIAYDKADYQNNIIPQRMVQLNNEIQTKQEEAWNNSSGADKFFSNLTDGLQHVADFATNFNLPGVTGIASDAYQTFRPGTREEREAEARANAVNNYAQNEYSKEGDYVNFRNNDKYNNLFKNDTTLDDPNAVRQDVLENVTDASVFDPTHKQTENVATGEGKPLYISNVFKRQLKQIGMTPEKYLEIAKEIAEEEGYNPNNLEFANDDEHKLMMYDNEGKVHKFGKVSFDDYITWSKKEAIGLAPRGYAEQKRRIFIRSHSKLPGDWKHNKFSPNNLALRLIWNMNG